MKKKLLLILGAMLFAVPLSGCFESSDPGTSETGTTGGSTKPSNPGTTGGGTKPTTKTTFGFNEKFVFDNLELTFKSDYLSTSIESMFSEKDGMKVVGVPVLMTNKKNEPHSLNLFYVSYYGPQGTELSNESAYFDEETSVDWGGNILPNATVTRYVYFDYAGDGEYKVVLDDFLSKKTVKFNITYVEQPKEPDPELGKAFVFDDLELTFSSEYTVATYDQPYSSINGTEYVRLPVFIKNVGDEANSLDFLSFKIYGSKGVEVDSLGAYFYDSDAADFGDSILPGVTVEQALYFEYDGDGEYRIDFGLFKVEKTLKFDIIKQK